jgi:hypothetical protein
MRGQRIPQYNITSLYVVQNVLSFTPPGFKQSLNVKFPDSRLAVCEACKKNFKTRDTCRVRNQHTAPPWTMAYICMTLDDSCLDEQGRYVDKPMICRMVEWQPYRVMTDFDKKTPVCGLCKKTNRTRSFCRDRHKHRQLPWCTIYVMLSALDTTDQSTVVAAPSKPIGATASSDTENNKLPSAETAFAGTDAYPAPIERTALDRAASESPPASVKDESSVAESKASDLSENISPGDDIKRLMLLGVGDDINNIGESRTMLVKVSTVGTVIVWLEQGDDGQLSRRNLSNALEGQFYNPISMSIPNAISVTSGQQQPGHDQTSLFWPMAYGMLHPNAAQQQYFHHMHQRQQVQNVATGWQFGAPLPQLQHQLQYQGGLQSSYQQSSSVQHVPVIQQSPSTPISGPDTPVAASPPTTVPSPAYQGTAGEASQQCFSRTLDAGLGQNPEPERRVSQSPAGPPMQPPPSPIPRLQQPQAFLPYPIPMTAHVPPQLNQPTYHQDPPHREQLLPHQHAPYHYQDTWPPYVHPTFDSQKTDLPSPRVPGLAAPSSFGVPSVSTEDSIHAGPRIDEEGVDDSTLFHCAIGGFPCPGKRLPQFQTQEGVLCLDGGDDEAGEAAVTERENVEDDENNRSDIKRQRLS